MKPVALPEIGLDMWEWIVAWHKIGTPVPPPPIVKALTIVLYAKALGTPELVETGTFLGHTLFFLKEHFERLQSIELDPQLHQAACKKFQSYAHVRLWQGDSTVVLPEILATLTRPTLFWLDGHYSGAGTARGDRDTPIQQELEAVLAHPVPGHVILVDDARDFGTGDYPRVDDIRAMVAARRPEWSFTLRNDIMRIHAPAAIPPGQLSLVEPL